MSAVAAPAAAADPQVEHARGLIITISQGDGHAHEHACPPGACAPNCWVAAMHKLAHLLESAEERYKEIIFDPHVNQRNSHQIGRLLALRKEYLTLDDKVVGEYLLERRSPVAVRAAAARLALAFLTSMQYSSTLTDEGLLEKLKEWVQGEPGAMQVAAGDQLDWKRLQTYATGLLALALQVEEVVNDVVRTSIVAKLMRYLRQMTVGASGASRHVGRSDAASKVASTLEVSNREHAPTNLPLRRPVDAARRTSELLPSPARLLDEASAQQDAIAGSWPRTAEKIARLKEGRKDTERQEGEVIRADAATDSELDTDHAPAVKRLRLQDANGTEADATSSDVSRRKRVHWDQSVRTGDNAENADDPEAREMPSSPRSAEPEAPTADLNSTTIASLEATRALPPAEPAASSQIDDTPQLDALRMRYSIQCMACMGEYLECLGPVLQERGVDVVVHLLRRHGGDLVLLNDTLHMVCALVAHRRFATLLVDAGGVQLLLALPRAPYTYAGISFCLFGLASNVVVMERICGLPSPVPADVVSAALELLACAHDPARKNAALFFAAAFPFRVVLDAFDAKDGMRQLLNLLRHIALVHDGTSAGRQVASHACKAFRQYFRAHFTVLVDSLRTTKEKEKAQQRTKGAGRAVYKPMDIGDEAIAGLLKLVEQDRRVACALAKIKWPTLERFMDYGGPSVLLDLVQGPPHERYAHDIALEALATLLLITLIPSTHGHIAGTVLSNDRSGMAVLLSTAHNSHSNDPEVIRLALQVLANLVGPPPSLVKQPSSGQSAATSGPASASKHAADPHLERRASSSRAECSPVVEQGYHYTRECLRANNGIKVLLSLLQYRSIPSAADSIRAMACKVLLGLARDPAIAHILGKLQVARLLSDLVREPLSLAKATYGGDQHKDFSRAALELISLLTNAGRASALAATDAAAPAMHKIERAAIVASTPINYPSKELLQLIHEHLASSGLHTTAAALLTEAGLPSPSVKTPTAPQQAVQGPAGLKPVYSWPNSRTWTQSPSAQASMSKKHNQCKTDRFERVKGIKRPANTPLPARGPLSPPCATEPDPGVSTPSSPPLVAAIGPTPGPTFGTAAPVTKSATVTVATLNVSPAATRSQKSYFQFADASTYVTPVKLSSDAVSSTPAGQQIAFSGHSYGGGSALDRIVTQYLKHQHRQCPVPISTLPPVSLLQPHVCPEPRRPLDAPLNVCSRSHARQRNASNGGPGGRRHDRHFVYSRFRNWHTFREEDDLLFMTAVTFVGDYNRIMVGNYDGSLRQYDVISAAAGDAYAAHDKPINLLQSLRYQGKDMLLSSTPQEVKLWDVKDMNGGAKHTFSSCHAGRFNHAGDRMVAIASEPRTDGMDDVYAAIHDVRTGVVVQTLSDTGRNSARQVHVGAFFSPSDALLLWGNELWDHRVPTVLHRFDQFTDNGGGRFHPSGNEAILNSEVWDLRTYKLLRSVPSLDRSAICFNGTGDVIYAHLRRPTEDPRSVLHARHRKHPLWSSFRTVDAVDYSHINTFEVDRCVMDVAVESTDSFVAVAAADRTSDGFRRDSFVRVYEVGRRRPLDPDPDDMANTDEEDDDEDDEAELDVDDDGVLGSDEESELAANGINVEGVGVPLDALVELASDDESDGMGHPGMLDGMLGSDSMDSDDSSEDFSTDEDEADFDDMVQGAIR
eukprot:jgi/Chlat1/8146/Chrsp76S07604